MQNPLKILIALVKREMLEHKNVWRVPVALIVIAVLLKLSLSFGNLAVNVDVPEAIPLDTAIDSILDSAVIKALHVLNYFVMVVMFIVAIFYTLACLYDERQDDSVLFWRSLPTSDLMTVASKLFIPLIMVPLIILVCQALNSVLFLGGSAMAYLNGSFLDLSLELMKKILWSLLPMVAWCLLCSVISKKTPFLLAFITPILLILIDKLFFKGVISETLIINRITGVSQFSLVALFSGIVFSVVCIAGAIFKRMQKV